MSREAEIVAAVPVEHEDDEDDLAKTGEGEDDSIVGEISAP